MGFLEMIFGRKLPTGIKFKQSKGFKGFKSFPMSIHGYKPAERNNRLLKNNDFSDYTITFHPVKNFFVVYLNNFDVGAIYDKEQIELLMTDQIEAVYAKHESKREFNGRDFEDMHYIKLFVKYREVEDA